MKFREFIEEKKPIMPILVIFASAATLILQTLINTPVGYAFSYLILIFAYAVVRYCAGGDDRTAVVCTKAEYAAAFVIFAAACLACYFTGVAAEYIFPGFDMFALGGTRTHMTTSVPVSILVYAVIPSVCEPIFLLKGCKRVAEGRFSVIIPLAATIVLYLRMNPIGSLFITAALLVIYMRTRSLIFCISGGIFIRIVTMTVARFNEWMSVSTGDRIDFAMASGMNLPQLAGFGLVSAAVTLIMVSVALRLTGRKYSAMEIGILTLFASLALVLGMILTAIK